MISERQVSSRYLSIWNEILPMSDRYMRKLNLESIRYVEPFESQVPPVFNALVNETAYRLFVHTTNVGPITNSAYEAMFSESKDYINKFSKSNVRISSALRIMIDKDIYDMCDRLAFFYNINASGHILQFNPKFRGCGIVDACCGDVFSNGVLYEVKAGNREFRAVDLRQIVVYLALNNEEKNYNIRNIALLNPRTGKYWISEIEEVFDAVSGASSSEILNSFIEVISQDRLSH